MIWQTHSSGSADTENLGEQLGKLIPSKMVIELRSDLGGGKTTLVRGLARGLGYSGAVTSPSFTLSREYKCRNKLKLYHFDFYRLVEPGIVAEQLAEALQDPNSIVAVEWSNIVSNVLPDQRLVIEFQPVEQSTDARNITIAYPESETKIIQQLETSRERTKP